MDLERFWQENAASSGKAFRTDKPRAPMTLSVDDHWLLEELALPSTVRYYRDPEYRAECHREANNRCEAALGIRPFPEAIAPPGPRRIEEVFGAHIEIIEGGTPWIEPGVGSPDELVALLDELEALDDAGLCERAEIERSPDSSTPDSSNGRAEASRPASPVWTRGPATIATSVLGTTEAMVALLDEPDLMDRFFSVLAETLVRYHRLRTGAVCGIGILDDNCALVSPALYRRFCLPVWKRLVHEFSPQPSDMRFQHSDSAMEHLLPVLAELDLTGCNFGPTVTVQAIRAAMPHTEIHGQVAPFSLRRSAEDAIAETTRDWEAAGADGGLVITTAGSIAAGTPLAHIRAWMEHVDRHCRYSA